MCPANVLESLLYLQWFSMDQKKKSSVPVSYISLNFYFLTVHMGYETPSQSQEVNKET